ncbi:MAG: hypothetical protein R2856_12685 [Caldilineaceae bacterium]
MFQRFEDEYARAFGHHHAVTVCAEGATGVLGIGVVGAGRAQAAESGDDEWREVAFGAARDHHVRGAVLDAARRLADGDDAGGASRDRTVGRSFCAEADWRPGWGRRWRAPPGAGRG